MKKLILYIVTLSFFSLKAQHSVEIKLHFQQNNHLPKKIKIKYKYPNQEKAQNSLYVLLQKLFSKGYIEASIDSAILKQDNLHAYVFLGKKYTLSYLKNGNLNNEVLSKIKFSENDYKNKIFSFSEIEKLQKKVLSFYENRGYAFAEVKLDSFSILNNQIITKIYVSPHQVFIIDTLIVQGNTQTTSKYLQNYLNIKNGSFYDKSKIDKINQKLSQLRFLKQTRDVQLVFLEGKIELYIFVEKQKSNEFDFLLGLLPNDKLINRKITITGEGRLHLFNSFGVGEEIFVDFKQLKPTTQNAEIKILYPYVLNFPFGFDGSFNLFKNDTSFLNLNTKLGFIYPFNGADFIKLFYQNQISNILNFDTSKIRIEKKLPQTLDKVNNNFGVELHFQNLDYSFNPRKGYNLTFFGTVGTRVIKENSKITSIKKEIYNEIDLESVNFNLGLDFNYYLPIRKRHSILIANYSKFLITKNVLLNEKFRIGGSKILRGFDEQAIFSPYFSVFTLEYHFSLSKNAYFYAFGDMALVEDIRYKNYKTDTPFGFGVGTAFETKGGIFSLSYALGKQLDNKIELKNGKIHFGYINLF